MNLWLSIGVVTGIVIFIFFWLRRGHSDEPKNKWVMFDQSHIQTYIRNVMVKLSADPDEVNLNEAEFNKRREIQQTLRKALRTCMQGDIQMKMYVKSKIFGALKDGYGINDKNIHLIIPFHQPEQLTVQDMFDILLYHFQKEHGYDALSYMIDHYDLIQMKVLPDGSNGRRITEDEIRTIYYTEKPQLSFKDKLNIVVQRMYQQYKGLGVIDEIRDMNIDGVNGGTSGLPPGAAEKMKMKDYKKHTLAIPRSHDAVWIFYKGKSINLAFLSFGSEKEIKRVCQNIYTYGFPGPLNESVGYKVNDMADGSRVVVIRPKLGENWAFFVRKFNDSLVDIDKQIQGKNAQKVIRLIYFLVRGNRGIAITGAQGAGKTMMLKSICQFIDPDLTIRVLEIAFELFLKKAYMFRNVFSMRETNTVSAQQALDMSKKTDGGIMVLGEVSSAELAEIAVQNSQSGGASIMLTGHMKTKKALIEWFRNSVVGLYKDIQVAEEQVIQFLNINIHLVNDHEGRHIQRISECIPVLEKGEYPKDYKKVTGFNEQIVAFMDTATEFFQRSTNRKNYIFQDLIVWREGGYVAVNRPSDSMVQDMLALMDQTTGEEFLSFLTDIYWERAA